MARPTVPPSSRNKEFYKKVANQYTALLSTYTAEGQCYRVDLRLRPDGTLGEICISDEGARAYYGERARDWEKQMLIKARVSAGESQPGAALLEFVEPLIYQSSLDFRAVEAVSETRQRISEKLAAKRGAPGGLDVKLTPGGIRDIEFLVQCLQRLHGGRDSGCATAAPCLRSSACGIRDFSPMANTRACRPPMHFLRHLEHRLQLEEDRQTHTLPNSPARLELLARKMPPDAHGVSLDAAGLKQRLQDHLSAVREIYGRVIHAYRQAGICSLEEHAQRTDDGELPPRRSQSGAPAWRSRAPAGRGPGERRPATAAGRASNIFWNRLWPRRTLMARLDASPDAVLDIFEHSPYFADQLLRHPELLEEIGEPPHLEGGMLRTAPRCAASTGARCSASNAKAFSATRPSSRHSAKLPCWPIR